MALLKNPPKPFRWIVVDDDDRIRELLRRYLSQEGFDVLLAHDRAVMLAGLSHDLRTPLARLRLEAELSVSEPQALAHMAADIGQLDAIIDKFTDYARPDVPKLQTVDLHQQVEVSCRRFDGDTRLRIVLALPTHLLVRADPVDLDRVLMNLLENAARYARARDGGPAEMTVSAYPEPQEVALFFFGTRGRAFLMRILVD